MTTSTARRSVALLFALSMPLAACGSSDGSSDGVASLDGGAESDTETDDTSGTSETTEPVDQEEAWIAFAECMRDNGVNMSDPTFDENGRVQLEIDGEPAGRNNQIQENEQAVEECQPIMPAMNFDSEDFDATQMQDQLLAFTQCMRDNGIDIDDPEFTEDGMLEGVTEGSMAPGGMGGGGMTGVFGELDLNDPATEAAFTECSENLAMFGGMAGGVAGGAGASAAGGDA